VSELLLSVLQRGVNRALALDPELPRILGPLEGTRLAVEVTGAMPYCVMITLARDGIALEPATAGGETGVPGAQVAVSGSPAALLALLGRDEQTPFGAGVTVRGDIGVLQRVSSAARGLRPDWEEPIARMFGDELGQPLSRGLRRMHATIGHVLRELHADAGEFLREESGLFAAAEEVDAFSAGVDELRDAVERLDKRLALLARSDARRP